MRARRWAHCRRCGRVFASIGALWAHEDNGRCCGVSLKRRRYGRLAHLPKEAAA